MKTRCIIIAVLLLAGLTACQQGVRSLKEAETLFQQGVEQRTDKHTEAAAESFSQALLAINRCNQAHPEVKRLKAQIEDNLGFCYWKHELFEEALHLHEDAATLARELGDSTLLMNALRNCGRATASLGDIDKAEQHYDEALDLAKALNDKTMQNEILLESSRDVLLVKENYEQVIERVSQALADGAQGDGPLTLGLAYYYLEEDSLAIVHLTEATKNEMAGVRMSAYQSLYFIHQIEEDYQKAAGAAHQGGIRPPDAEKQPRSRTETEKPLSLPHPWRLGGGLGCCIAALATKIAQCQAESRRDEEPNGAGAEEKQGVCDRPCPHRANYRIDTRLRPERNRMGRLRGANRQGLWRLHQAADGPVSDPHQE